jgi:hypothetical protein
MHYLIVLFFTYDFFLMGSMRERSMREHSISEVFNMEKTSSLIKYKAQRLFQYSSSVIPKKKQRIPRFSATLRYGVLSPGSFKSPIFA